jgi:hypothetical protein
MRYRTVHDRLHEIEREHFPAVRSSHEAVTRRVTDIEQWRAGAAGIVDDLEGSQRDATSRLLKLETTLGPVEEAAHHIHPMRAAISDLTVSLGKSQARLDELDQRVRSTENRVGKIGDALAWALPPFVSFVSLIDGLVQEVCEAIEFFEVICESYAGSNMARRPFATYWNTIQVPRDTPDVVAGERWGYSLRMHLIRCRTLCDAFHVTILDSETMNLKAFETSGADIPGTRCLELLKRHRENLRRARTDHATAFSNAQLKAMMS